MKILLRIALNTAAVWVTFALLDGLSWDGEWLSLVIVGVLIGVVNAFIKPIVKLLALPIRALTLGLFTLVINVVLMGAVIVLAEAMEVGVSSESWGWTLLAGLVITVVSSILSIFVGD